MFSKQPHYLSTRKQSPYDPPRDSGLDRAVQSMLPQGEGYTALELKVNPVRAVTQKTGRVRAEGKVVPVGSGLKTSQVRHSSQTRMPSASA